MGHQCAPLQFSSLYFGPNRLSVSGTCDTRETVLKRDGTNVVTDSSCKATSGNWVSPYDGVPTDLASDLDIVSVFISFYSFLS